MINYMDKTVNKRVKNVAIPHKNVSHNNAQITESK